MLRVARFRAEKSRDLSFVSLQECYDSLDPKPFKSYLLAAVIFRTMMVRFICALLLIACPATAFIPLIDGGKGMPKLYDGWFNDQLSKQAASAVSRVSSDGVTDQK